MAEGIPLGSSDRSPHDDPRVAHIVDLLLEYARGNLGARLKPSGLDDDLDAVVVGLNVLGEELEGSLAELSRYRERLENIVEDRTAEVREYADAMQHMELGVIIFHLEDPDDELSLRIVGANLAVELHAGYRPEELIGKSLVEIMPEIVETDLPKAYAEVALTGVPKQFLPIYYDHNRRAPDSYWSIRAFPTPGRNVGIIFENVTERVRLTERALQVNRELEMRFSTVFNSAGVGIAIADGNGRLIQTNPSFQDTLGYTENEFERMNFADVTHPDDRASNLRLFREMIAGIRDGYQLEKRYISKNGSTVWANVVVSALGSTDLGFRCVAMVQDVTARRLAELELETSQARFAGMFPRRSQSSC